MDKIYVRLLDEGIDVWKPVMAKKVTGSTYYKILDISKNNPNPTEKYEFMPGATVEVIERVSDGIVILVATRRLEE